MKTVLTGRILAVVLEGAADGCETLASEEETGLAVALSEVLHSAADIARRHGDTPVDIDISIGPSPGMERRRG